MAAESAQAEAQQALDGNAADIAAAQAELGEAQSAKAAATVEVEQAQQQVGAAQGALNDAQDELDRAQAAIEAEVGDPGTNAGHKEWTAYGFFKYVRDNAPANSAAYWDAQCAMDILDGGVNTTGHAYATHQGPGPDGENATQWANIADNIVWDQRGDAVGLDNFRTALQLVDEFNAVRAEENRTEGTNLRTDINTNCRQMAISIVQCDTSKINSTSHTNAYEGLENLSWSSASVVPFSRSKYIDPYAGWYDEEKANYKANNGGVVGHYKTIVDLNSGYYCEIVGAAVCNYGATLGECREISTFGDFFNYDTNPTPEQQYSIADFTDLFNAYYAAQVEAGMFGTTDAVKAEHRAALQDAQANVTTAQANLEDAETNLANKTAAENSAIALVASKQAKLEGEQGKTAGLQAALDQAAAAATAARTEANDALAAYQGASDHVTELQNSDEYAQAKANRDAKQSASEAAADVFEAAEGALSDAQANLEAYTNLATNENVAIASIAPVTYDGTPQKPEVTVSIGDDVLIADTDYTVAYENNTNAGTASVNVTGINDFRGTKNASFTINPQPVEIPVPATGLFYTGEEQTGVAGGAQYTVEGGAGSDAAQHTATVTLKDAANYCWSNGTTNPITIPWSIDQVSVVGAEVTLAGGPFEYTGSAIKPDVSVSVNDRKLVAGTDYEVSYGTNTDAGTGTVTITGVNGYKDSTAAEFTIAPVTVQVPTPVEGLSYNGKEQTGVAGNNWYDVEDGAATAAGSYTAKVSLKDTTNSHWPGGKTEPVELEWSIARTSVDGAKVTLAGGPFKYTGSVIEPDVTVSVNNRKLVAGTDYEVSYGANTDAGTGTVAITGVNGYKGSAGVEFTIAPAVVKIPKAAEGLTYNGAAQEGVAGGDHYTVTDGIQTEKGSYVATATLDDPSNYAWSDGTTEDKKIAWSIGAESLKGATVSGIVKKTYNGKAQTQKPTVKLGGKTLTQGTDYTLGYKNNINAGTATVSIIGAGDYSGSVKKTFTISKAANPMTAKVKAKSVKYAKVKKKAQVVKGAIVVSKAQGKVTYTVVAKGSSKKLSFDKKTGKITVKKGTKKGTYKIKVKIAAAGNGNYNKATKTVTASIKVK